MRLSTLVLTGVLTLTLFESATTARGQARDDGTAAAQQKPDRTRRRLFQPPPLPQQQLDARDKEALLRRQQIDNERIDRARQVMQEKYRQWQQLGDRRSYRELRNAYLDWLDEQRARDEAANRFARRWQREHPGAPYPAIPGMTPPTGSDKFGTPNRAQAPIAGLRTAPGSNPGIELPSPAPSAASEVPPIPSPPQPRRLPAPSSEPLVGPSLPEPTDDPVTPEMIPAPPSAPATPSAPAPAREL